MASKVEKACIHYLNLGPWPGYVGFTTSAKDFQREMKRIGIHGEVDFVAHEQAAATTHFFFCKDGICIIVTAPPPSRKHSAEQYAAIMAHEAGHVVEYMRDELAAGKMLGSEAEAYLIQFLVQEFLCIAKTTGRCKRIAPQSQKP